MLALVLISTVIAVAARPSWNDLNNYSFDQFVKDFKFDFKESETEMRRSLFHSELARVRAHNSRNDVSWKEGINKFSAMTVSEKKGYTGRSKSHASAQVNQLKYLKTLPENFEMKPIEALPPVVDWRKKGIVSAVKDQGYCGSCWAFASTATIESIVAKETGLLFDLSVEQMAMCAPNPDSCGGTGGCAGSTAELAFEYVSSSIGLFQEYQYPYTSYYGKNFNCTLPTAYTSPVATINGYVKLPENNYTALLNAVATIGPIAVSVDASSWGGYESGIFDGCNLAQPDIDHAVVLVGYGPGYWLIRNSWSAAWGEEGYIKLKRSGSADENKCGSDITPQDGTACAGETDPVKVCGTCGVLYDSSYPLNAAAL